MNKKRQSLLIVVCLGLSAILSVSEVTSAGFTARLVVSSPSNPEPARPQVVSVQSLLEEMVDRDVVARWPAPAYVCKQASSHDRRKKTPADPEGWHSNVDYGQFLRAEVNQGRQEWVIMDDSGPGAVTRFWTPLNPDMDGAIIRFYFDGKSTPVISVKFNDLFRGCGFVRPPLAFVSWNETDLRNQIKTPRAGVSGVGSDLYLPISFAKGCKITLDKLPFYYVINYRIYEPGTAVETFSMAGYEAASATLKRVSETLLTVSQPKVRHVAAQQATLPPGDELAIDLPDGPAAVRCIQVQIDPKDAPQVLRSTIVRATFDGKETAWCPFSEFFGAGARLNPVQDWWRTVRSDGTLAARWTMPYQHKARVAVKNVGGKPVTLKFGTGTGPWVWDQRSLHFHANWHCQLELPTRPFSDWNYLEVKGRGLYVGDTLTVFSPVAPWFGEGDERIFIDGAKTAAHIGTGTEDYYGYAWGMAGFFNSPFISMPQRDCTPQDNWRGYTTTSRVRLLDAIPWRSELRHNMEIWNWADTRVDYAVGTFFYAAPGAKHNRSPQPDEAARALRETPQPPPPFKIKNALECESMTVMATSPHLQVGTQDAGLTAGEWSGGKQLFIQATRVGDFIELAIPATAARACKVMVYGTKSADYGILRFTINGKASGKNYDAYAPAAIASGPIQLGTFQPVDGKLRMRVEVVGANVDSKGPRYYFGLDCVVLGQ
jgi:hypothetical protein